MDYIKTKLKGFLDKEFIEEVNKKGGFYVAGGALTSLATNREINDIDIFFPNRDALLEAVLYLKEDNCNFCSFISDKSITYSVDSVNYQFIYFDFYEKPEDIFKHFDFTVCMAAYSSLTDEIVYHKDFFLHNSQRHLSFNPDTKFPILSALRVQKYEKKGYKIPRNEFVKICLAINKCEINSWDEFRAQCGQLYGCNFIQNSDIPDSEFSINAALEVISKVNFDGKSVKDLKFHPAYIDLALQGEPLKYCIYNQQNHYQRYGQDCNINEMVLSGAIKAEEISLKEYFGDFIYKWVREDLTSHYDRTFQYVIGEEAVAKGNSWGGGGQLWFTPLELAPKANYNGTTLLKCEYQIEDFLGFAGQSFLFKKAKPVKVITNEELATLISIPPVSDNSDRLCF